MYDGYYNGSLIFFDTDVTDEARRSILDIENEVLDYSHDVSLEDKYFDDVPDRYKKLIPNIRYEDIKDDLVNEINDATIKFINSIKAIENAIYDYCDGDGAISSENKATLDFYLGQSKSLSYDNDSDKKTIINQVVTVDNNSESTKLSDNDEISMLGDDISGSLYSATSLNKENDDSKNNTSNSNDVSMAAIVALNGKIIYDRQQETDDVNAENRVSNGNSVNNSNLSNEESVNDGLILGTNSVEFKNNLLDAMIGDD